MENYILRLTMVIQKIFQEKINIVILLLVVIIAMQGYSFVKLKKKIDHRYFNLNTIIEEIFNVKTNTLNGELKEKVKLGD